MKWLLLSLFGIGTFCSRAATLDDNPLVFTGMCDASAAVALSGDLFAAINDEDNLLRFYRLAQPGKPIHTLDLKPILSSRKKAPEADFEGAARVGNRVFLITSHGRSANGKNAPLRHRFLALEFKESSNLVTVTSIGTPYTNLVADLARDPRFERFNLAAAAGRAPKTTGALNIEALTDTPDGTLFIGFRNPLFQGNAIIIPLLNPNDVINRASPKFGDAILLDLGGLGLRGIGSKGNGYYLIGGPIDGEGECRLFTWDGVSTNPRAVEGLRFPGINPEGICFHDMPESDQFLILSDDGARSILGIDCKTLPESQRRFRAFRVNP